MQYAPRPEGESESARGCGRKQVALLQLGLIECLVADRQTVAAAGMEIQAVSDRVLAIECGLSGIVAVIRHTR